jgi:hypothetical protein
MNVRPSIVGSAPRAPKAGAQREDAGAELRQQRQPRRARRRNYAHAAPGAQLRPQTGAQFGKSGRGRPCLRKKPRIVSPANRSWPDRWCVIAMSRRRSFTKLTRTFDVRRRQPSIANCAPPSRPAERDALLHGDASP